MSAMTLENHTADAGARITLPEQFANAPVTVRTVSEAEVVVRLAAAEDDLGPDGVPPLKPLSNTDRDFLLNLLDNPPEPNDALKRAAARYKGWYERDPDSAAE
jgi:hypothetical protein